MKIIIVNQTEGLLSFCEGQYVLEGRGKTAEMPEKTFSAAADIQDALRRGWVGYLKYDDSYTESPVPTIVVDSSKEETTSKPKEEVVEKPKEEEEKHKKHKKDK